MKKLESLKNKKFDKINLSLGMSRVSLTVQL